MILSWICETVKEHLSFFFLFFLYFTYSTCRQFRRPHGRPRPLVVQAAVYSGPCCPLSASFTPRYWRQGYGQHVGNFTLFGGDWKIPAHRGLGSNLGPLAQNGRTLGARPPPPPADQASFRPGQSCCSQALNLTQYTEDGFKTKQITGAVFVDLTAACGTVNHRPLVLKVAQTIQNSTLVQII